MHLQTIIDTACDSLSARQSYARDVIAGRQRWSGADLTGKAKKYGVGYYVQRNIAREALDRAGGVVVAVEHGRLVTGVHVGQDDYGNAVYHTTEGAAVQVSASSARVAA